MNPSSAKKHPRQSHRRQVMAYGLIYCMAVVLTYVTLPWPWHTWMPSVFFLVWCYGLPDLEQKVSIGALFCAWLFGLSVDFWTSIYLGPFAMLYISIRLGLSIFRPYMWWCSLWCASLVYHVMFLWIMVYQYLLTSWFETWSLFNTSVHNWIVTYLLGWFIILVRAHKQSSL